MANIYLDRTDDGAGFKVTILAGRVGKSTRTFTERAAAEAFALSRMGRLGSVQSTLDLTPEQLAAVRTKTRG